MNGRMEMAHDCGRMSSMPSTGLSSRWVVVPGRGLPEAKGNVRFASA